MSTSCRKGNFPTCKMSDLVNWYLCVWSIVLMKHSIYLFWNSLPHFYNDCIKHLTRAITLGIPSVPILWSVADICPDKFNSGRQMSRFFPSHKIHFWQLSQTSRFWRDSTDFESSVPCPGRIYGGSHICIAFQNVWITLTNRSKVFSALVFLSFLRSWRVFYITIHKN
jgi:hypothetical protein